MHPESMNAKLIIKKRGAGLIFISFKVNIWNDPIHILIIQIGHFDRLSDQFNSLSSNYYYLVNIYEAEKLKNEDKATYSELFSSNEVDAKYHEK